jgi:hypothetical protein
MTVIYKEVEVDVEITDFDDEDLIEELERRGKGFDFSGATPTELLVTIYQKRRLGRDYQQDLDDLIYTVLGKVV